MSQGEKVSFHLIDTNSKIDIHINDTLVVEGLAAYKKSPVPEKPKLSRPPGLPVPSKYF